MKIRVLLCLCLLCVAWLSAPACGPTTTPGQEGTQTQEPTGSTELTKDSAPDANVTPEPSPEPNSPEPEPKPEPTVEVGPELKPEATPVEKAPEVTPEVHVEAPPKKLTYHKDIRAVIENRCTSCHKQDGIGPFKLTTYQEVHKVRSLVKFAVKEKKMPPWGADKQCNQYHNDFDLTDKERASIIKWVDDGAVEGDPNDYKAPPPPPKIGLDRVDVSLKMKKPYQPDRKPDDYRCFILDWTPKATKFITGFQVKPGNPKIVHHIIAYLVQPGEAAQYIKKDQRTKGEGYRCYGVAGGPASLRWLGVWAPGVPGSIYPKDTGIKVVPGSKIILQLHYNVPSITPKPDQSTVSFQLEDKVKKEAIYLPWTNPLWLSKGKMKIPAGKANVQHSFGFDLFAAFPLFITLAKQRGVKTDAMQKILDKIKSITIHDAMMHMHVLGRSGRLHIERGGKKTCLLNLPRWDFNWQLGYRLKNPITIKPGDSIGISCAWDNTPAKQPTIDGKKQTPIDVFWGDGTRDEMCLGLFYITCQDKAGATTPCPDLGSLLSSFL